jgi:hypothetical protein
MSALAALTALAMTTQATPAVSPLFDAFKAACFNVHQFEGVGKSALAAGWTQVAETEADPRIVAILAKGRAAIAEEEPDAKSSGELFRHKIDGRDVYLATSRVQFRMDEDSEKLAWGNGCRVYDLDMPAAPPTPTATGWVGKPPTGTTTAGSAVKLLWESWQTGVSLEITYVPSDNEFGKNLGVQGLILVSQAIGGF